MTTRAGANTIIIYTNDVHGRLTDNIGYDGLAAYVKEKREGGNDVILLDAGDAFQGKIDTDIFEGESALTIMNALNYDAMAIGNHDFDFNQQRLFELRKLANFPFLSSNILSEDTGEPVFSNAKVLKTSNYTIGVFGLSSPGTKTSTKSRNTHNLIFASGRMFFEIAQKQVDNLKKQGCDYIICLCHLGIGSRFTPNSSEDLAKNTVGIDFIIDGHSHTKLPRGISVGNTMIVSSGCHLKNIGTITLSGDKTKAELISDYVKKDNMVTDICKSYKEKIINLVHPKTIGESKIALNITNIEESRTKETPLGDLMADAFLYATRQMGYHADCSLINGGSFRDGIASGPITKEDIYNFFPYNDTIRIVSLPGSILLMCLEKNTAITPSPDGGFPQVSGIEFTINIDNPYVDGKISRVVIKSINGKPFDQNKVYSLVTDEFIGNGGDKYNELMKYTYAEINKSCIDALSDFISKELNGIIDDKYAKSAGRIHLFTANNRE